MSDILFFILDRVPRKYLENVIGIAVIIIFIIVGFIIGYYIGQYTIVEKLSGYYCTKDIPTFLR